MNTIKLNSKGIYVEYIAYLLDKGGLLNKSYTEYANEKAIADEDLIISIRNYQSRKDLIADGIVGNKTWSRIMKKDASNITISSKLDVVCFHCSATYEGEEKDLAWFEKVHIEERGWSNVAYGLIIHLDGRIEMTRGRRIDYDPFILSDEFTFGILGKNGKVIDICYVGGLDINGKAKDTTTPEQNAAIKHIMENFIKVNPNIKFAGHYQFANKACPSWKIEDKFKELGIENIYKFNKIIPNNKQSKDKTTKKSKTVKVNKDKK